MMVLRTYSWSDTSDGIEDLQLELYLGSMSSM